MRYDDNTYKVFCFGVSGFVTLGGYTALNSMKFNLEKEIVS